MTTSRSLIPAEITEVDRFGSDPEFLQYAALRGATWEREREREERRHMG
jgi:hypothetical protein